MQGSNDILAIWEDDDSTIRELTFEWFVLSGGDATILGNKDEATLNISDVGSVEVLCKITDENGNYNSKSKIFTVL